MLPIEPSQITNHLINVIFETQLRSFSTMSSVGLIIANLPPPFHSALFQKANTIIKTDPLLLSTNFYKDKQVIISTPQYLH